jgi:hypothetical protein
LSFGTGVAAPVAQLLRESFMNTTDEGRDNVTAPADLNPGDQAPAGSPQTGENVCATCKGAGKTASGAACETCGGTGKVIELVGDA